MATEVVRLSRNENTDLADLARVISRDPAIATKILGTASSAIYLTRSGAPTTIQQAVMRLGGNTVMTLALSFSLIRLRGSKSSFDYTRFWKRALAAGTAARCIAEVTKVNPDEAFLAGLFQDIGILALHEVLGSEYADAIAEAGADHLRLERLERERLSTDHREAGVWLARKWKLPGYLEHTTRGSHNPDKVEGPVAFPELVRTVALSGYVADIWVGHEERAEATRQAAECAKLWLNMGSEGFTKVLFSVARAMPELSKLFEVAIDESSIASTLDDARDALVQVSLNNAQSAIRAEANASALAKAKEEAESQARKDALTGLFNRGFFDTHFKASFESAKELGRPLTVVFCDLDHFKSVNDKFGHQAGDAVLQTFAKILLRCLRQLDVGARYGGEEFALILPATDRAGAAVAAERLRKLLEKSDMPVGGGRAINVTASFGCATMDSDFDPQDEAELLKAADDAVYVAKREGRNRVVHHRAKKA